MHPAPKKRNRYYKKRAILQKSLRRAQLCTYDFDELGIKGMFA